MENSNESQLDINAIFSKKRHCNCAKLKVHDWLSDIPNTFNKNEIVEVRFKNTRKDYYRNVNGLSLKVGDVVAVEANPGHDIGMVSLTGDLVLKQMKRHKVTYTDGELRKVYRKAKPVDIKKWEDAIALEHSTMIKSRELAEKLGLQMKIGDVEYQGDKTKAIFYYIADERVDFRQLIKVYAETFRIRIEMKQIGARQEAGRIGGIGPCGRELCCSSWISNFVSVTTNAARYQEISLNPQKLAGQCGKLKCCLNFELDCYMDAQKDFPSTDVPLKTRKGNYVFQKADIFKRILWYILEGEPMNFIALSVDKVKSVIKGNMRGKMPDQLTSEVFENATENTESSESLSYQNVVGQDSLDRFDSPEKGKSKKNKSRNNRKKKTTAKDEQLPVKSNETPKNETDEDRKKPEVNNQQKENNKNRRRRPASKRTKPQKTEGAKDNTKPKENVKVDNKISNKKGGNESSEKGGAKSKYPRNKRRRRPNGGKNSQDNKPKE